MLCQCCQRHTGSASKSGPGMYIYLTFFGGLNVLIFNELISSVLYNLTSMIRGRKLCTHLMTAFHFYSFLGILSPKAHSERVKILSEILKRMKTQNPFPSKALVWSWVRVRWWHFGWYFQLFLFRILFKDADCIIT